MPSSAKRGESIEVKTLVSHPMESGFRYDNNGEAIPRDIIENFEVRYLGEPVFAVRFGPGIASNPFLSFFVTVESSGTLEFVWTEQSGEITTLERELTVIDDTL